MDKQIKQMLTDVRMAISRCIEPPESVVLEYLLAEAEGWKMRLKELKTDEANADE